MRCPSCGGETKVIDSRELETAPAIRRRRECLGCDRRCTTYEMEDSSKTEFVEEVFSRARRGDPLKEKDPS